MSTLLDLSALPDPQVVEELSFEDIFQGKLETFLGMAGDFTALLESDPAIKLLEADAYDEMVLRQRVNDAARARLLAYAQGGDLDQLAVFYGVTRLTGETDTSLKVRVREAIMGRSAAGTKAQYRFAALSASTGVADAAVDSPQGGVVRISILSATGDGTPDNTLLNLVRGVVTSDSVRALCHAVEVVPAEIVQVDVTAQVWLTTTAPEAIFAGLDDVLRAEFAAVRGLGYNLAPSWIIAKLQASGVQRVQLSAPATQVAVASNQCAALRNINLTLAGRDY